MRFSTSTLLALLPSTFAYYTGFNIAATTASGACRTQQDWEDAFNKQRSMPLQFATVRLYASSDCNTLQYAVPAALATQTYILAGVWATDADHYNAEKQFLLSAIKQYGHSWLIGVSVGSEDLYRAQYQGTNEITPSGLAQQIYDVRGMLTTVGIDESSNIPVGHVDTWTSWVDNRNIEVIQACDFVGTDAYPYFQYVGIDGASAAFASNLTAVRNQVNQYHQGIWVWITETGWPVSGPQEGAATPSVANQQAYWNTVGCDSFNSAHTFWYTLEDYSVPSTDPSFGVVGSDGNPLINLSCP